MNAHNVFRTGAFLTATGMSFGAFGAHALRARTPALPERAHASWTTASSYLVYNGLALLALSFHPGLSQHGHAAANVRRFRVAAGMILGGAAVFSGTIFALVLARDKVGKVLGPLTPVGGAVMIAGYAVLALS